jgi:hypothetical protein
VFAIGPRDGAIETESHPSSENTSNAAPFHKGKEEISLASHAACSFPRSPSAREDRSTLRGGGGDEDVGRSEFALAPFGGIRWVVAWLVMAVTTS